MYDFEPKGLVGPAFMPDNRQFPIEDRITRDLWSRNQSLVDKVESNPAKAGMGQISGSKIRTNQDQRSWNRSLPDKVEVKTSPKGWKLSISAHRAEFSSPKGWILSIFGRLCIIFENLIFKRSKKWRNLGPCSYCMLQSVIHAVRGITKKDCVLKVLKPGKTVDGSRKRLPPCEENSAKILLKNRTFLKIHAHFNYKLPLRIK